jgi:hypothetical protein
MLIIFIQPLNLTCVAGRTAFREINWQHAWVPLRNKPHSKMGLATKNAQRLIKLAHEWLRELVGVRCNTAAPTSSSGSHRSRKSPAIDAGSLR